MTVTSEVVALCSVGLTSRDKPVRDPSAALYWTLCELGFMSGQTRIVVRVITIPAPGTLACLSLSVVHFTKLCPVYNRLCQESGDRNGEIILKPIIYSKKYPAREITRESKLHSS